MGAIATWKSIHKIKNAAADESLYSPKVEKQEKKKVPKGRAKKRLTYTRRFVNVQLTGGKRKVCSASQLLSPTTSVITFDGGGLGQTHSVTITDTISR